MTVLLTLGILLVAWVATAVADGGDPSLVHACVQQGSGQVRIVGPGEACRGPETPLHWPGSGPSTEPLNVTVHCAAGETVAAALARGVQTTSRLTITVIGVCQEAVTIFRDAVTLEGASVGDGLQALTPASTVLTVLSQRVNLNRLTITGGTRGVAAFRGAAFRADDLRVTGASSAGVFLQGGTTALLVNPTIENGSRDGIELSAGSSIVMSGGVVRDHGSIGVHAETGSQALIVNGARLANNAFRGGLAGRGGSILLVDSIVEGSDIGLQAFVNGAVTLSGSAAVSRNHARFGLFGESGAVHLDRNAQVTNNGSSGVLIDGGGTFTAQAAAVIENNAGHGVEVTGGTANFSGGSESASDGVIVRNNGGDGVHLRGDSFARFFPIDATPVGATQITGNVGHGIFCSPPPALTLIAGFVGTVSGNGAGQIACPLETP